VLKETPTRLDGASEGHIHEFLVITTDRSSCGPVRERAAVIETVVAAVLEGLSENDAFNQLLVSVGLEPKGVVLLRAWFRYLRKAPDVARGLIALFDAAHDPDASEAREEAVRAAEQRIAKGLAAVAAIDDDRILRLLRGVIAAVVRTNAFAPSSEEALAFKLDS